MSRKINRKTKLFIYPSYIRPKLEYANIVYGSALNNIQSKALEDVQRKALLSCTGAYQHTSHIRLLQECGIEPLATRRKYFRLCHVYKIIHGLTPRYLSVLLPPYVYEVTRYPLRNILDFHIPGTRKAYLLNYFMWYALNEWNHIDQQIRQSNSIHVFKKSIKDIYFYKGNSLYNYGIGIGAVNHARLRMGLSGLNAHRKKYNFIHNNDCPYCGQKPEN